MTGPDFPWGSVDPSPEQWWWPEPRRDRRRAGRAAPVRDKRFERALARNPDFAEAWLHLDRFNSTDLAFWYEAEARLGSWGCKGFGYPLGLPFSELPREAYRSLFTRLSGTNWLDGSRKRLAGLSSVEFGNFVPRFAGNDPFLNGWVAFPASGSTKFPARPFSVNLACSRDQILADFREVVPDPTPGRIKARSLGTRAEHLGLGPREMTKVMETLMRIRSARRIKTVEKPKGPEFEWSWIQVLDQWRAGEKLLASERNILSKVRGRWTEWRERESWSEAEREILTQVPHYFGTTVRRMPYSKSEDGRKAKKRPLGPPSAGVVALLETAEEYFR